MQEKIITNLRMRGHRITAVRRSIIDVFVGDTAPITAIQLQNKLKLKPNKSTIYRELQFLVAEGVLAEVSIRSEMVHYELSQRPHHHHLICQSCEAIEDVLLGSELSDIEARIEADKEFKILTHQLEFFGLCGRCR